MANIESLGYAMVFKAGANDPAPPGLDVQDDNIAIRSEIRVLSGMQKEAVVYNGLTGTTWRMVSDEGPYLNGTDLAPFPLAFYTTGMALSFTEEFLRHAHEAGVDVQGYQLSLDNFYTMEGSALRGDMIGGALPARLTVDIEADASEEKIHQIAAKAVRTCPAQFYMSQELANTFSLNHNGREADVSAVAVSPNIQPDNPIPRLEAIRPLPDSTYSKDIIVKLAAADTVFGVEGGAGSSLKAAQKRTLHVRGICVLRDDGTREVTVQLFKPLGSTFRFISDPSAAERAPSSLDYLAAGVGFCFMTQIGRYAAIVEHDLKSYSIVQDTVFQIGSDAAGAAPVDTHTFLLSGEEDEAARQMLFMSERTCFLHAAMRSSNDSELLIRLNGSEFQPRK